MKWASVWVSLILHAVLGVGCSDSVDGPDDAFVADEGPYCAPYTDCGASKDIVKVDEGAVEINIPDEASVIPEPMDIALHDESWDDEWPTVEESFEEIAEETVTEDVAMVPKVRIVPTLLDFGYIQAGITAKLPFSIQSVGTQALTVTKITLKGPSSVSLLVGFEGKKVGNVVEYKIQPPKILKVGSAMDGEAVFKPTSPDVAEAEVRVFCNDPSQPDGAPMFIIGNKKVPCVRFVPDSLVMEPTVVGETKNAKVRLESCSQIATVVFDPKLDPLGAQAGLSLDFSDFPLGVPPTLSNPLVMVPEEFYNLRIQYSPTAPSPVGPDGKPIPKKYQVSFQTNTFDGYVYLPITVVAVEAACTTPVIKVAEGTQVDIGTLIHLSGKSSFSPFGQIVSYEWAVVQPEQNSGSLMPSAYAPEPTFLIGVPGDYTFKLRVTDEKGNESCQEASVTVQAAKKNRMTVILSWSPVYPIAPIPPNLGPDVDLHFIHPKAFDPAYGPDSADIAPKDGVPDGWFDTHWDCFWYNRYPNTNPDIQWQWWSFGPYVENDTKLLFDSQDGTGPEVLEHGLEFLDKNVYHLGVHFFDDYGYGPANVTLLLYMAGDLVYQYSMVMNKHDLWDVGILKCNASDSWHRCTQAQFVPNPGPLVWKNYQNPAFNM